MSTSFGSDETADIDDNTAVDLIEGVGSVTRTREGDPLARTGSVEDQNQGPLGGPSGVSRQNRTGEPPHTVIEDSFRAVGEFAQFVGEAPSNLPDPGETADNLVLAVKALLALGAVYVLGQLFSVEVGS